MTPTPRVNNLIGGVLGRSLAMNQVELFAFVFLSNHFHLIVRAKPGELARFMGHLQGNIAREIGREVDWHGKFWHRRYSAEAIVDDASFVGRLGYIFAHGVKEGLVNESKDWPGLTCIPEITRGQRRLFPWVNRSLMYRTQEKGKACTENDASQRYKIKLATPPVWQALADDEKLKTATHILQASESHARQNREGKGCLGATQVKAQNPHRRTKRLMRSPRPICHAATPQARKDYTQTYRSFSSAYQLASLLFREGLFDTAFPKYSYRPPPRYGLDD